MTLIGTGELNRSIDAYELSCASLSVNVGFPM
jgi:hypothetical protein